MIEAKLAQEIRASKPGSTEFNSEMAGENAAITRFVTITNPRSGISG